MEPGKNIWNQGEGSDDMLRSLLQEQNFGKLHSRLPLKKLKNNLLTGILWAAIITAFYIYLFWLVEIWQVRLALVVLILSNTWITVLSIRLYKNTDENILPANSLKKELQRNYESFQNWWSIQEKLGLFVYPIGAAGGFILGGVLGSGKPVEAFLYNPRMLTILGITILILVPITYYAAKWMFRYAFGKHLKKIKLLIDELSQDDESSGNT